MQTPPIMAYMKFHITIERDEDGRYVTECIDLPGCLSEGDSPEEALENISEAIIGCLKSRLKRTGEKEVQDTINRWKARHIHRCHRAKISRSFLESVATNT